MTLSQPEPIRAERLLEAALWLRQAGDVRGAMELVEKALALDPVNSRATSMLWMLRTPPSPRSATPAPLPVAATPTVIPSRVGSALEVAPRRRTNPELGAAPVTAPAPARTTSHSFPAVAEALPESVLTWLDSPPPPPRAPANGDPAWTNEWVQPPRRPSGSHRVVPSEPAQRPASQVANGAGPILAAPQASLPPVSVPTPMAAPSPLAAPPSAAVAVAPLAAASKSAPAPRETELAGSRPAPHAQVAATPPRELDLPHRSATAPASTTDDSLPELTVLLTWEGDALATSPCALAFLEGPLAGQRLPMTHETLHIGDPGIGTSLQLLARELIVRDNGDDGGTYVSIRGEERIDAGTYLRAGNSEFLFERRKGEPGEPDVYVLHELGPRRQISRTVFIREAVFTVGRTGCTLSLPEDRQLASPHFELTPGPWATFLENRAAGSGTFVRLPPGNPWPLQQGDTLRIGDHLLRIEAMEAAPKLPPEAPPPPPPESIVTAAPPSSSSPARRRRRR